MPIHRYQIRNVYSLADPELYKPADKDDPEALLEGVAMAGLVGVLRQLGDLAEFAADIFHDLHEEVMATAARGHDLRVRVQQLESEMPPIERAFLSQTSHSAFFPNSGIDWHPNRQTTQNLITKGDLPRFVMDSYEECRGPPRLFLLDKFDIGGAGACLKRYTDPSTFKVEASSYEIENAETQREKKICQTKKKGLKWKGGETPEVSQPSHAKLHQLFLEDRVQTGATEAAHHVKLKTRPKKFPFDSESRECYMNKLLNSPSSAHEVPSIPSNGSRLEDGVIIVSALGLPMKNTSPCVSSSKLAESQPSHADLEVDDSQITVDNVHTDGLQDGYPSEDVATETDNYMDALATMDSEVETSLTQGTYSYANKHQLQSQLSDSQSIKNLTASYEGNNSTTKGITGFGNSDTTSTSIERISPVRADSPPRPFACIEIPFRPRVSPVADYIPVTQNLCHTNTNDTCIDTSKVSNVNQVESVEKGTSNSNEVCSGHTEKLDSPRKSEEHQIYKKDSTKCTSEHSDVLPIADGLSSFSFVRNHKGDLDDKYPTDSSIPMVLPNTLERTNNQVEYDEENHHTDSVASSSRSITSRLDELFSDTTFNDDIHVPKEQLKEKGDDVLVISDQAEARVLYSNGHKTESDHSEIELRTVDIANTNEFTDSSVLKEGTGAKSVREIESTYSDANRDHGKGIGDDTKLERIEADSLNIDTETSAAVLLTVDVDNHEAADSSPLKDKVDQFNNQLHIQLSLEIEGSQLGSLTQADHKTHIDTHLQDLQSSSESYSALLSEKPPTMELSSHDIISDQDDSIAPCHHESNVSTEADHNIKSKSLNHGDHIDVFEAPTQSSPLEDMVDQPIDQLNLQIQGLQSSPESYSVAVSEKPPTMELNNNLFDQVKSPMLSGFGILPQLAPVKPEEDPPPLPPLPPMQWRTRKLQSSLSTPTISHQEVFWPSSSPYPFPPVLDEMHTNIRPMKVQRPRSPLIDAVAAHDKTKLRKVSDQDATQMPKGEERDTLLDQIRAKSINLKPAVQTRPIIQGPGTNLRVAAILEKANAIRQAFAGSDDDDDSDNWSDL